MMLNIKNLIFFLLNLVFNLKNKNKYKIPNLILQILIIVFFKFNYYGKNN